MKPEVARLLKYVATANNNIFDRTAYYHGRVMSTIDNILARATVKKFWVGMKHLPGAIVSVLGISES